MFKIIAVTNRNLCKTDLLDRIKAIVSVGVDAVILREKDLIEAEYETLANNVMEICTQNKTPCILHQFASVARRMGTHQIHLPLEDFAARPEIRSSFSTVGVSVHSLRQAQQATVLGADYLIAGHIFETDCKRGLAARGVSFLHEVCESVRIPVFAIGGIDALGVRAVRAAGAHGACIMSALMQTTDVAAFLHEIRRQ